MKTLKQIIEQLEDRLDDHEYPFFHAEIEEMIEDLKKIERTQRTPSFYD